jgi:hypothetical protein
MKEFVSDLYLGCCSLNLIIEFNSKNKKMARSFARVGKMELREAVRFEILHLPVGAEKKC